MQLVFLCSFLDSLKSRIAQGLHFCVPCAETSGLNWFERKDMGTYGLEHKDSFLETISLMTMRGQGESKTLPCYVLTTEVLS